MFKLVRNEIPKKMQAEKMQCNYAQIQNNSLYQGFLLTSIADSVNELIQNSTSDSNKCLDNLIDIFTLILNILTSYGLSIEEFERLHDEKLATYGDFTEKYIVFFPDASTQGNTQHAASIK